MASALTSYRGPQILLRGLRELTPAVARILARWPCGSLWLGLPELDPAVATPLAQYRGELYLPAVTAMTDDAAEALAQSLAARLCLDSLPSDSGAAAVLRRCARFES